MAYNEKQKGYAMNYAKRTLKRIPLDVKKEYYEDVIVPAAKKCGSSVRAFILDAIAEKIERDTWQLYVRIV